MENQQGSLENKKLLQIPGFGNYFADSKGNIYSIARQPIPKKLKQWVHYGRSKNPYMRVKIKNRLWLVHRFLGAIKIGRPLLKNEVINHIDGITDNNELNNLEVVSQHENVQHAVANNLYCKGKDWYKARGIIKI